LFEIESRSIDGRPQPNREKNQPVKRPKRKKDDEENIKLSTKQETFALLKVARGSKTGGDKKTLERLDERGKGAVEAMDSV